MAYIIESLEELEEIKENIDCIEIDDLYGDTGLYLYDTSLDNPLLYEIINNGLYINREFYELNKEKVLVLVEDVIKSTKRHTLYINSKDFINECLIDAIISNKNILSVNFKRGIELDKKTVVNLLNNHIHHLDGDVNFEKNKELLYEYIPGLNIQNYPNVAGASIMNFGNENVELFITKKLSENEIKQLKLLFKLYPQEKVHVNFYSKEQIKAIIEVINSKNIVIRKKDTYSKEEYMFFDKNYDNITFDVAGFYSIEPKKLILREELFESIIKEVKSHNLSPLENYMYLYNIVKMFKEYKESPDVTNRYMARYSEFTLFNDHMVCVGYATLLSELVDRLNDSNLSCTTYSCNVLDNDNVFGHCRCIVYITDDKYEVRGIYISDPTWDSISYYKNEKRKDSSKKVIYNKDIASMDSYNHFLLTKEETLDENIQYYGYDATDILFLSDTNKDLQGHISADVDVSNIKNKFGISFEGSGIYPPNSVDKDIIISAIRNIYSKIYIDGDLDELVNDTIKWNIKRQKKYFKQTKDKFGCQKVKMRKK